MTLHEAYIRQYRTCLVKGVQPDKGGHYKTNIDFRGRDVYVSPDGSDVTRYVFPVKGCEKTRLIRKNGKAVHFHKDILPVYGTITRNRRFKGFVYKYLLFLRCDGIDDSDLLLLYVLEMMRTNFEFWRKNPRDYTKWVTYEPEYEDVRKMLMGLIGSAMKKVIDDRTREQFKVLTRCVVNPEHADGDGAIRKKTKKEKFRDARKGTGKATDNRIKAGYDPGKTDRENAEQLGISVRRLQTWKKSNLETVKDRVRRLYDPKKSVSENARICNVSESSIHRYKRTLPKIEENEYDWIDSILESDKDDIPEPKKKKRYDEDEVELLEWVDKIDL